LRVTLLPVHRVHQSSLLQNSSEKVIYQLKWLERRVPILPGVEIGLQTKPERIGK